MIESFRKRSSCCIKTTYSKPQQLDDQRDIANPVYRCMRRLQANLSYMAGLAGDKKPEAGKAPSHPAYLTAPKLNLTLKLRAQPIVPEGRDFKIDPVTDREERDLAMKELYQRLQSCFPGIDPNKEPVSGQGGHMRQPTLGQNMGPGMTQHMGQAMGQKPQGQGFAGSPTAYKTPQMMNMPGPQPGMGV